MPRAADEFTSPAVGRGSHARREAGDGTASCKSAWWNAMAASRDAHADQRWNIVGLWRGAIAEAGAEGEGLYTQTRAGVTEDRSGRRSDGRRTSQCAAGDRAFPWQAGRRSASRASSRGHTGTACRRAAAEATSRFAK